MGTYNKVDNNRMIQILEKHFNIFQDHLPYIDPERIQIMYDSLTKAKNIVFIWKPTDSLSKSIRETTIRRLNDAHFAMGGHVNNPNYDKDMIKGYIFREFRDVYENIKALVPSSISQKVYYPPKSS